MSCKSFQKWVDYVKGCRGIQLEICPKGLPSGGAAALSLSGGLGPRVRARVLPWFVLPERP